MHSDYNPQVGHIIKMRSWHGVVLDVFKNEAGKTVIQVQTVRNIFRKLGKITSTPARAAFRRARSIISGDASVPYTSPLGPVKALAAIVKSPVPQPTSKTLSPGVI
jgi:hypothetical protein